MSSITEHFRREMGLTLEEFKRSLPAAITPLHYRIRGRSIRIEHPAGEIHIQLQPTTERRIAALAIPLTPVEFTFYGLNDAQRRLFMQQFNRHFQRGGG
ncbi:MAG: hypothetical protein ABFS45_03095 [Pseudomonadota bacterium]